MPTFLYRHSPARVFGLLAAVAVIVSGCSDGGVKKVTVNGSIAYKGERLSSGMLQFIGPNGSYSASRIQSDGTFIITDVVPGEVKVGVMEVPQSSGSSSGEKSSSGQKSVAVTLPEKYRDPEKSGVKYTITPDTTELHIDLD